MTCEYSNLVLLDQKRTGYCCRCGSRQTQQKQYAEGARAAGGDGDGGRVDIAGTDASVSASASSVAAAISAATAATSSATQAAAAAAAAEED